MSFFFSSRYMLELEFVIYHRAASLSSQASSVDACSIGEESLTRLCSNAEATMETLPVWRALTEVA